MLLDRLLHALGHEAETGCVEVLDGFADVVLTLLRIALGLLRSAAKVMLATELGRALTELLHALTHLVRRIAGAEAAMVFLISRSLWRGRGRRRRAGCLRVRSHRGGKRHDGDEVGGFHEPVETRPARIVAEKVSAQSCSLIWM